MARVADQQPGTVRVTLAGHAADVIKTIVFLDRVTGGDSPAAVLRVLHLTAITITSQTRAGRRVTLTLELQEVTPGVAAPAAVNRCGYTEC
jgi:hypothetical protein